MLACYIFCQQLMISLSRWLSIALIVLFHCSVAVRTEFKLSLSLSNLVFEFVALLLNGCVMIYLFGRTRLMVKGRNKKKQRFLSLN